MNIIKIMLICFICALSNQNYTMQLSPLLEAARVGDSKKAQELLDQGADPNARDKQGCTPLYFASLGDYGTIIHALLSAGANAKVENSCKCTPLHKAAMFGYSSGAQALLDHGADPNAKDEYGWTPLHFAASGGHLESVCVLLRAGANAQVKDDYESTPLHEIFHNHNVQVAAALQIVNSLIAAKADVNARDLERWTPLYLAATHGKKFAPIIQALKEAHAVDARPDTRQKIETFAQMVPRGHKSEVLSTCPY